MVLALNGKELQRSVSEILQCKMRRFGKSKASCRAKSPGNAKQKLKHQKENKPPSKHAAAI